MKKQLASAGLGILILLVFAAAGHAWKVESRWECCYPKPKERVVVKCKDGRAPVYVNMGDKWCKKDKGQPDGAGRCFKTLDEGARWWCKE